MLRRAPVTTAVLLAASLLLATAAPASARSLSIFSWLRAISEPAPTTTAPTASTATTAVSNPSEPVAITEAAGATIEAVTAPVVGEMTETCGETVAFKAFAAFGDQADYAFAPGGTFEQGAAGWSLDQAQVVSGNETAGVYAGSRSLFIRDRGRAVSPWFCVTADHPHFRYVARGGEIEMEIDYKIVGDDDIDDDLVGETNAPRSWAASQQHELATEIPSSKLSKGVVARIIFEAEDDVWVDNVLVDPYRRG